VSAQDGIDLADLLADLVMPNAPHQFLQRQKASPEARLLGTHTHLEVALPVPRAVQRQTQIVDGFRAFPAATLARVSLSEPAELDQFGLARLQSEAEPAQPTTQSVLYAQSVRPILETGCSRGRYAGALP